MLRKLCYLLLAGGLLTAKAHAQNPCGTDDVLHRLQIENPALAVMEAKLEQEIQEKLKFIDFKKFAKTTAEYYDIPIVVHIIHEYGAEYVTDDAIFNAVNNWSNVFQKKNADTIEVIPRFKPIIGNPKIRLHLATKDPNGKPTKGITRRFSYLANNADDQAKLDWWPNDRYINLWFVGKFSSDHSGAAAYAYYPSSGANWPWYDGIIGVSTYLDYQKAIPHEIGHVLNLQHTWGNTNAPNVACGDDLVSDTPPTKGHLPSGCTSAALFDVTCASPDTTNAQNIMDYTYCDKMFTIGQVNRMHAALLSSVAGRNNLFSTTNLLQTGALVPRPDLPPVPDFSVEKAPFASERSYFLCANSSTKFNFRNRSWNDTITDVQWTFSNGAETPSSTSMTTVLNKFSQAGWVTVSLTATGNNSGSATYTNDRAVYVADENPMQPAGYYQSFSSTTEMDNWPMFNYYNNNFKWEWYNGAGYWDNASVRYRSFDSRTSPENKSGKPTGDFDDIITPGFNLTNYASGNLNLNFFTAGATKGSYNDSLQILISYDCGRIWKRVASITGSSLANNGIRSTEFVPSDANQWKAQTIAIPSAYLSYDKVFFKFRYFPSEGGNDMYLDRFSLTPFTTEVEEVANNFSSLKVYPNPSNGNFNMTFRTGNDGLVTYFIKDITGKVIFSSSEKHSPNTVVTTELNNAIASNGVYLLTVVNANNTMTEKLVISK